MAIHWERDTRVPATAARDWFFDLQEDDHTRGDHKHILRWKEGDYRKVLSRGPDRVEAEDAYRGGRVKVHFVLHKEGADAIRYEVRGDWYDSTGLLRALPQGDGSRIEFDSDMRWKGFGRLVKPFMSRYLEKAIVEDMAAHVDDLEQDWASKPWA